LIELLYIDMDTRTISCRRNECQIELYHNIQIRWTQFFGHPEHRFELWAVPIDT